MGVVKLLMEVVCATRQQYITGWARGTHRVTVGRNHTHKEECSDATHHSSGGQILLCSTFVFVLEIPLMTCQLTRCTYAEEHANCHIINGEGA